MKLQRSLKIVETSSKGLERLVREDAVAYARLVKAQRTRHGIAFAQKKAIGCPLEICERSVHLMQAVGGVIPLAGPYLGSDLKVARSLLEAAYQAARTMVMINLNSEEVPSSRPPGIRRRVARMDKIIFRKVT